MSNNLQPTEADLTRDLLADLAVCDAATPGPWEVMLTREEHPVSLAIVHPRPDLAGKYPANVYGDIFRVDTVVGAWNASRNNLDFIVLARDALPAALRRLLAVEAEVKQLRALVRALSQDHSTDTPSAGTVRLVLVSDVENHRCG